MERSRGESFVFVIASFFVRKVGNDIVNSPELGQGLGQLLDAIKSQLQLTLLVIEHDIPLIMGLGVLSTRLPVVPDPNSSSAILPCIEFPPWLFRHHAMPRWPLSATPR